MVKVILWDNDLIVTCLRLYDQSHDYRDSEAQYQQGDALYGGSILGEKIFIKQALSKLKEGVVSRKETSHRRLLESKYQSDVIVNAVSVFFGIDNKEVLNDRKDRKIRRGVQEIMGELSQVKACPHPTAILILDMGIT